eukprot:756013-Hanusia_phi.AAC.8
MVAFPDFAAQNFYQLGTTASSQVYLLPPPRVFSISPAFGPRHGGTIITITGQNLKIPSYDEKLTVAVGAADCSVLSWTVNRVVCSTPAGADEQQVQLVLMSQQGMTRLSEGAATFSFLDAFMAYSLPQTDLSSLLPFSQGRRLHSLANVSLPGRINALQVWEQRLFVGGTFRNVAVQDGIANHLVVWDGNELTHLGLGLDGAISTMAAVASSLMVGGTFSTVYTVSRPLLPSLSSDLQQVEGRAWRCGGLAQWDGATWSCVGGATVDGHVTVAYASGDVLYVAGPFGGLGGGSWCGGLAMFNGSWACPWGRVTMGEVKAIAVWRDSLVVGGSFRGIGGSDVSRIARYRGSEDGRCGKGKRQEVEEGDRGGGGSLFADCGGMSDG